MAASAPGSLALAVFVGLLVDVFVALAAFAALAVFVGLLVDMFVASVVFVALAVFVASAVFAALATFAALAVFVELLGVSHGAQKYFLDASKGVNADPA